MEANKQKYDEKLNRIYDAIFHKETDRVPINVDGGMYAVMQAGYTVKDIIYDITLEKAKDAISQYLLKYDPDMGILPVGYAGEGEMLEMLDPSFFDWSGRPGSKILDNSLQQFLENPPLAEEDFDEFFDNNWKWRLQKCNPSNYRMYAPMAKMNIPFSSRVGRAMAAELSKPEMKELIQKCWKLTDMYAEHGKNMAGLMKHQADLGYPRIFGGKVAVAYDEWGDEFRGTLDSTTDLYLNTEAVERFIKENHEETIDKIKHMNPDHKLDNKTVFMTLHKGHDGFLSKEQFEKYYWPYLREIIYTIVDIGMIPQVFLESNYSTRLDYLKEVPAGRVIYQIEYTPLEEAKKVLGDRVCLMNGFRQTLLTYGTKEQVQTEAKRIIDTCAPGGGYIFGLSTALDFCKPELVEALYEVLHNYGKK